MIRMEIDALVEGQRAIRTAVLISSAFGGSLEFKICNYSDLMSLQASISKQQKQKSFPGLRDFRKFPKFEWLYVRNLSPSR